MESKSAVNLVFLDACRNNPLAGKTCGAASRRPSARGLGPCLARVEPASRDT